MSIEAPSSTSASTNGHLQTDSLRSATLSSSTIPTPPTALAHARGGSPASSIASSIHGGGLGASSRKPLSNVTAHQRLLNPPTVVEYYALKFVIMDAPSDSNLVLYIRELEKHNVHDVVRACDPTYSKEPLEQRGIRVHELNFKDGDPPPSHVVNDWLALCLQRFSLRPPSTTTLSAVDGESDIASVPTIATHCVAGLGRAPVLVAIALIEAGMANLEAVEYIRSRRRGALNSKQVHFVDTYKRRGKGKLAKFGINGVSTGNGSGGNGVTGSVNGKNDKCCVM